MKVRTQTNLVKRGTVWQFRKKVPKDLQEHYGKESLRQSLGHCSTISEAKREAGRLAAQLEAEFCSVRAAREPVPAMPLTAGMIPQIAKALHGHILAADEEVRTHGMDADAFDRWELETAEAAAEIRKAYGAGV